MSLRNVLKGAEENSIAKLFKNMQKHAS
jgi:hypothetical protein